MKVLWLPAVFFFSAAHAVEFERMSTDLYYQTIEKAHKAYRAENFEKAFAFYNLTARWGEKDSQRQLGLLYLTGQGTEIDPVEGYAWLLLAAESGRREDREVLKQALEQITEETKTAGEKIYQKYLPLYGLEATGIVCKRRRAGDTGRKTTMCERPFPNNKSRSFDVPVVETQHYWAIEDY